MDHPIELRNEPSMKTVCIVVQMIPNSVAQPGMNSLKITFCDFLGARPKVKKAYANDLKASFRILNLDGRSTRRCEQAESNAVFWIWIREVVTYSKSLALLNEPC